MHFVDMADGADSHKKKKLTVKDVFNDDDASEEMKKKRPLMPLGEQAMDTF